LSPYNPIVKKLYRIDGIILGKKVDAQRYQLEIDICGIRKLMNQPAAKSGQHCTVIPLIKKSNQTGSLNPL
jgi:hypothetical protein